MASVNNGSGYEYGIPPKVSYPMYGDGTTPSPSDINITASASVDETTGTPSAEVEKTQDGDNVNFAFKFAGLKGEKGADGAQGPQGEKGDTGATGATGPDYNAVVSTAITNENGVYSIKNTMHDGTEQEAGTIEVPESDAGIVEVKDTVVENNTSGYDFHTITETQNDGTENEVGKFYIAQKQYLPFEKGTTGQDITIPVVDQSGVVTNETILRYRHKSFNTTVTIDDPLAVKAITLTLHSDIGGADKSYILPNIAAYLTYTNIPSTIPSNYLLLCTPIYAGASRGTIFGGVLYCYCSIITDTSYAFIVEFNLYDNKPDFNAWNITDISVTVQT